MGSGVTLRPNNGTLYSVNAFFRLSIAAGGTPWDGSAPHLVDANADWRLTSISAPLGSSLPAHRFHTRPSVDTDSDISPLGSCKRCATTVASSCTLWTLIRNLLAPYTMRYVTREFADGKVNIVKRRDANAVATDDIRRENIRRGMRER